VAIQRWAATSVVAATFYLPAVPVAAAGLPGAADRLSAYDASAEAAHQARGWAAREDEGAYSDYGYAAPRRRDDRYDDDPRWASPDDRQTDSYPAGRRALGLDRVAETCVSVVERERDRVNTVDGLARDSSGWSVSGSLSDGSAFSCRIGIDGRLQDVHFGRERATGAISPATALSDPASHPEAQAEPAVVALSARFSPALGRQTLGANVPAEPEPTYNLSGALPSPAAANDGEYRVARLPPPPEVPGEESLAGARELPAQSTAQASTEQPNLAARSSGVIGVTAPSGVAPPAADASQVGDDDSGPLPPADTSEALPVDPNQSPVAANPAQPKDDGRYSASQARDFGPAA
jgi:hypothetical protein